MFGIDLAKPVALLIIAGASLAVAGGGFYLGMRAIDRMEDRAATTARAASDAHWKAEIGKSNAEAAKTKADSDMRFAAIEVDRMIALARAAALDAELERKNAELPKPDACALDVGRWRLLDGPAP
jgi:hypothetical protein